MSEINNKKTCSRCKEEKLLDCFSKKTSNPDGLQLWCRPCQSEYYAKYRKTPKGKASKARAQTKFKTKIPPAIYQIVNKKTGEVYIGQSKIPNKREVEHWTKLKAGNHRNPNLQQAYNRYSRDAFEFQIVEHCEPDQLKKRERYWIKHFGDHCYNVR